MRTLSLYYTSRSTSQQHLAACSERQSCKHHLRSITICVLTKFLGGPRAHSSLKSTRSACLWLCDCQEQRNLVEPGQERGLGVSVQGHITGKETHLIPWDSEGRNHGPLRTATPWFRRYLWGYPGCLADLRLARRFHFQFYHLPAISLYVVFHKE